MADELKIGSKTISNRLFIGTGKFSNYPLMKKALEESRVEVATVALRRVDAGSKKENILDYIPAGCTVMINTSGARNADEAVRIARLAKAAGSGDWIKIEVVRDNKYLLPDNIETLKATEILAKEGFKVFPYMNPDLSAGRRMLEAGAAAVMPLGSPIGTNRGLKTKELVEIMVKELDIPVIVDAGLGRPSDACICMELGCAAVLVNTAIAVAPDPVGYAVAFSKAVEAGRQAFIAGLPLVSDNPSSSSPLTGFLRNES